MSVTCQWIAGRKVLASFSPWHARAHGELAAPARTLIDISPAAVV
jgi:hypothetical protein